MNRLVGSYQSSIDEQKPPSGVSGGDPSQELCLRFFPLKMRYIFLIPIFGSPGSPPWGLVPLAPLGWLSGMYVCRFVCLCVIPSSGTPLYKELAEGQEVFFFDSFEIIVNFKGKFQSHPSQGTPLKELWEGANEPLAVPYRGGWGCFQQAFQKCPHWL